MGLYGYGDILDRTKRLSLSHIRSLPEEMGLLTKGDLAEVVKGLLEDLEADEGKEENEWSMGN